MANKVGDSYVPPPLGHHPFPHLVELRSTFHVPRSTFHQDDIFGVVPFLLAKEGVAPKSGLTFTAKDPITVVFSIDTAVLKVCMDGGVSSVAFSA